MKMLKNLLIAIICTSITYKSELTFRQDNLKGISIPSLEK